MTFSWLNLDDPASCATYAQCWQRSAYRRPHDHPAFLTFVRPDHYAPAAVIYEHSDCARIVYPFFHCEVNRCVPFRMLDRTLRHLVSPYGYGGALFEGDLALREEASTSFEKLFAEEMKERHFVSEFVREDIFRERLATRSTGETDEQPNVVVNLGRSPEQVWQNYKHTVRSNVNRAVKCGLRVAFDRGEGLDKFMRIYYETMERRGASKSYFFPRERFGQLASNFGKAGTMMYAHVYDGEEVVSTELLLLSGDTIYSFLGGSLASAFAKRPNNLLKHEVILWGGAHGYKRLVLGGGRAPGDELLRFKQSFDPGSVVPFTVRRVIHDSEAYSMLVEVRRDYELRNGRTLEPDTRFFPQYFSCLDSEGGDDEGVLQRSAR